MRRAVGLARVGHLFDHPCRSKASDGGAGDHGGGHGQHEADDAADDAAQRGDDEHDQRVDVEPAAHDLGLDEVLQRQVGGEHDHEHDGSLTETAVAESDEHRQPPTHKRTDVGDVAADEVHHHDGEHEREAK